MNKHGQRIVMNQGMVEEKKNPENVIQIMCKKNKKKVLDGG